MLNHVILGCVLPGNPAQRKVQSKGWQSCPFLRVSCSMVARPRPWCVELLSPAVSAHIRIDTMIDPHS